MAILHKFHCDQLNSFRYPFFLINKLFIHLDSLNRKGSVEGKNIVNYENEIIFINLYEMKASTHTLLIYFFQK